MMRKILAIEHVEKRKNGVTGKEYWRTHAVLDDGTECIGYGKDFDLNDSVEVFLHKGIIKMRHKPIAKEESV